jgi:lipoate synthase
MNQKGSSLYKDHEHTKMLYSSADLKTAALIEIETVPIRRMNPTTTLETPISISQGSREILTVIGSKQPEVVSHNMETAH